MRVYPIIMSLVMLTAFLCAPLPSAWAQDRSTAIDVLSAQDGSQKSPKTGRQADRVKKPETPQEPKSKDKNQTLDDLFKNAEEQLKNGEHCGPKPNKETTPTA